MENIGNVKEIVEQLLGKVKGDSGIAASLRQNPVETVKGLIDKNDAVRGLLDKTDIDDKILAAIANGLLSKLTDKDGDGAPDGIVGNLLDKAKDLIGGKKN